MGVSQAWALQVLKPRQGRGLSVKIHPTFLLPRATEGYSDVRRANDEKKEPLFFMMDTLNTILKEVTCVAREADRLGTSSALNPTS